MIEVKKVYDFKGVHIGTIYLIDENLEKPNFNGSGKTLKQLALSDPKSLLWDQSYVDALYDHGKIDQLDVITIEGKLYA